MWNDSDSDEERPPRKRARLHARKEYSNPNEFHERFRLTHALFEKLHQDIGQFLMPDDATNKLIDSRHKLLLALRFFATEIAREIRRDPGILF